MQLPNRSLLFCEQFGPFTVSWLFQRNSLFFKQPTKLQPRVQFAISCKKTICFSEARLHNLRLQHINSLYFLSKGFKRCVDLRLNLDPNSCQKINVFHVFHVFFGQDWMDLRNKNSPCFTIFRQETVSGNVDTGPFAPWRLERVLDNKWTSRHVNIVKLYAVKLMIFAMFFLKGCQTVIQMYFSEGVFSI